MAVYRPSEGRNQKKAAPPAQPNLVPIMNLFLSIIPFLLMMVVITQVAMVALNFSASAGGGDQGGGGGGAGGGAEKEVKIVLMASEGLDMFAGFDIREKGADNVALKNADNNGKYNYVALNSRLAELHTKYQDLKDIIIVVYPDVKYGTLIQTIDLCKQNGFPNVKYKPAVVSYGTGG